MRAEGGKQWQAREGWANSDVLAEGVLFKIIQRAVKNREITLAMTSSAAFYSRAPDFSTYHSPVSSNPGLDSVSATPKEQDPMGQFLSILTSTFTLLKGYGEKSDL